MIVEFSKSITIGNRSIGTEYPTYIIAEIGVNHNGDMELAKRTIAAAAKAGVDCVKFQSFRSEEFMADHELIYEYDSNGRTIRESMYEMFKRLEFPLDKHQEVFNFARTCGVEPLTSVADPICMKTALDAGLHALKLSSEDLINHPLLDEASIAGVPLILSTGMADKEEIKDATDILKKNKCWHTIILHCVSLYPTEDNETNLNRMLSIGKMTGTLMGYSDHTLGNEACIAAVAMGASVIEKHFTLDKNLPGPDHKLSADPHDMKTLVTSIKRIEQMMGNGELDPGKRENEIRLQFRRSIVAARDLPAGKILHRDDLALKRPGFGMRPKEIKNIIGRKLLRGLSANEQLNKSILS